MESTQPRHIPRGIVLILLAGIITVFSPVINLIIGYREFDVDMRETKSLAIMSIPFFVMFILPIQLLLLCLIQKKHIHPIGRTLIILAPALVFALPNFIGAVMHPVDAKARFTSLMDHRFPSDSTDFQAWRSHGAGDSIYMFSFNTTPESTTGLLAAKPYEVAEKSQMINHLQDLPVGGLSIPKGWPKPKNWEGMTIHRLLESGKSFYLLTNNTKSKVFVITCQ